jgi:hypothetical protein
VKAGKPGIKKNLKKLMQKAGINLEDKGNRKPIRRGPTGKGI